MSLSRRQFLGATLGAAAITASPAHAEPTGGPPNIVFLFSDDHSVPDLGCYDNSAIRTPNLDALAATGLRLDRAYVTSPQCSPSRASILTGRTPHAVNASRLHQNVTPDVPNLPRLLKQAGYHTGALRKVHQNHIQKDFDYYGNHRAPLEEFFAQRPKDQPFFLWFGSTDPHRDYAPGAVDPPHDPAALDVPEFLADTPETRQDLALYYDEIGRFDRECGEILALLEANGLRENTLVVMSADNGMPFPRAKATLYEPGIRVPLIANWPGVIAPGRTSSALVSLMDLTRTWLDAAGAPAPESLEGHSLLPLFRGESESVREMVFSERNWHDNWDPVRCVVTDRYKLIQNYRLDVGCIPSLDLLRSPSFQSIRELAKQDLLDGPLRWYHATSRPPVELYDLEADPGEWNNLAGQPEQRERVEALQKALGNWMNETGDFLPPPAAAYGRDRAETLNGDAIWWE
ncbi:MAG: sulfatase [Candidatus Hydrogenedentes bacterium]|nr:sulfatase [Candidatus Hydrogenedentota bacterium]